MEIERGRPLKYKDIAPNVIFKKEKEKEKLFQDLNESERKLTETYNNEISEVQAPVWLIRTPENIIEKEINLIKQSRKLITLRAGFLLKGEAQEMLNAFNSIPRNVKIKIIVNNECYVDGEKIEIGKIFKKSKISNLEVIISELPVMKMLIIDEKELFGTFAEIDGKNNSVNTQTLIGVNNKL